MENAPIPFNRQQDEKSLIKEETPPDSSNDASLSAADFDPTDMLRMELAIPAFGDKGKAVTRDNSRKTAEALYSDTTAAAAAILARECAIRRLSLNQADTALATYRKRMLKMETSFKMLEALSRDVEREHRRLLASIEALRRLTTPENPVLNISKGQTYIRIEQGGDE